MWTPQTDYEIHRYEDPIDCRTVAIYGSPYWRPSKGVVGVVLFSVPGRAKLTSTWLDVSSVFSFLQRLLAYTTPFTFSLHEAISHSQLP